MLSGRALPGLVLLGEFGRAHGLRGEIRLKSFTEDPLAIAGYGPLGAGDGRSFILTSARRAAGDKPDLLVVTVAGIGTRDDADALNRVRLYAERARLAAAAAEDEFLLADLVGLEARAPDKSVLGRIVAVPNYGAGDLLEIAPPAGPNLLVPFTKAFVPVVDIAAGRIVVDAPAESPHTPDSHAATEIEPPP